MTRKRSVSTVTALFSDFTAESALWHESGNPFSCSMELGHGKVALLTGPNASGKSFLAECVRAWGKGNHDVRSICISIRERTGSGSSDMSGMARVFIFGDESMHSTGSISARVVSTAFSNLNSKSAAGEKWWLVLDEPELGLSEGFCRAVGELIGREATKMHSDAFGVLVVSHSKAVAEGIVAGLGCAPTFLSMGAFETMGDWLGHRETRTVEDLVALPAQNREMFLRVQAVIDAMDARSKQKPRKRGGAKASG